MAASEYVQAVTDYKLLVFSKSDWEMLLNTIPDWVKIIAKVVQKCLVEKIDRRSPLVAEDATTRYLSFLKDFRC